MPGLPVEVHTPAARLHHQVKRRLTQGDSQLSIAVGDYDRMRPLMDGVVQIDGVDPFFLRLTPEEIFFRALRHAEFDVCELSLSSFFVRTARERLPLCRAAGVSLARLPPHRDLHPDRDRASTGSGRNARSQDRRAGIPAHRECLGARDAGGGSRR